MHRAVWLLAPMLAACTPAVQDQIAREAARSTITKVVVQSVPGVPVEPAVNCVIDNANAQEILALAADTVTGPTEASFEIVSRIASRAETLNCLVIQGLPALVQ